ncbi:MAG TPA: lysine--tRNA ligase [Polyangiaceae bacterium LLY-WYZ-14_1]|nr:lysine--tRNA ligase [Polyangiaceae bacterium LLY-WYZ-14_1]
MATEEELKNARRAHADKLRAAGTQAYPNDFVATDDLIRRRDAFLELVRDEVARARLPMEDELPDDAPHLALFGRVMAKRGPFLVVRTPGGDGQALVRKDVLPGEDAAQLAQLDLADHILVEGPAIRTKTGAAAVSARRFRHVGKALLPPPAKFHGLRDVEKRYRERYVDLFANPEVAQVFRARTLVVQALRRFLDDRGFLEVETPLLHALRGGATARPFSTHHNALDLPLFLRVAPELHLKRLLVGGLERVYEIGRAFRNEGVSTRHNPEFTILEFYAAFLTYRELMELGEALIRTVDDALRDRFPTLVDDRPFTLAEPFHRVTMRQAILDRLSREENDEQLSRTPFHGKLDPGTLDDPARLEAVCHEAAPELPPPDRKALEEAGSHGERIFALYELLAEPALTALYRSADGSASLPVFVTEYPFEVSPLARRNDAHPAFVDRFELFVEGREVANAFSELNDPDDQADRFQAQLDARARGDDEAMDFDADYVRALQHGMPPAAGFGLGVDRLVMLLTGQPSIRDVLFFPLLRPAE